MCARLSAASLIVSMFCSLITSAAASWPNFDGDLERKLKG